jgi:hypothetical protein
MSRPKREPAEPTVNAEVVELEAGGAVTELDDCAQADDDTPPIGEPFALSMGADLLPRGPGVPGCYVSMRCDCGRAFKVDLLNPHVKPCPGCGTPYSHALLVAPVDDRDVVAEFYAAVEGTELGEADDDGDGDDTSERFPEDGYGDDDGPA